MTLRSGKVYKDTESETPVVTEREASKGAMEEVQRLLQQLAEDRVQRGREFDEQRNWREEERKQHGEETKAYLELIAKLAEAQKVDSRKPAGLSVKLVPLGAEDDIEAYLVTFERILTAHGIDKTRWSHFLAPQLTGKAQLAFAALSTASAGDYEAIKASILARYGINEDAYRVRFRSLVRRDGETNKETATRLMDLLQKWMKEHQTVDAIQQVVGLEQFLNTLPLEKRLWVHEKKPKTCIEAGELVDEYDQIRRKEPTLADAAAKTPKAEVAGRKLESCAYCRRTGHTESDCRKKSREVGSEGPRCYRCRKVGHMSRNCPERTSLLWREESKNQSKEAKRNGVYLPGTVEGKKTKVLLDTGCSRTMVSNRLVPLENYLEGRGVSVRCAHGDINFYPLAQVEIGVKDLKLTVEAAVAENPTVPVLLGTDVPELFQLLGRHPEETSTQDVMVVMTRARARQQLEEEILRKEKERAAGARPRSIEESNDVSPTCMSSSEASKGETLVPVVPKGILDISADELRRLQEHDSTLADIRRMVADGARKGEISEYFMRDGLLCRRWAPHGRREFEIEQLVLPKRLRRTVLELAHEIPLAGHLGKEKTRRRVLRRFFWPNVFGDVDEFCRTCSVCQKASHKGVGKAPLMPLPVISEPFSRVAMDIVGPLLTSRAGNRYVLVVCDYATRYPEAIPLKSCDAEHVAEKLVELFARVGIPREILTDQGSNFMSQLLVELYRLLHVKPIRTSPYHPQTDGLVERFNQTLKSMLRKATAIDGKDWDKLIPYLLFAYREVPQASTGFSPFELLYGRDVRGPLDILRETWEGNESKDESVVSYVLSTRDKLKQMVDCVHENLTKQQDRQKRWYDTKARMREFKPGDLVLVLLPTSTNKLLAQWQGPYQVVTRMGKLTYLLDMHDRRKRQRVFHVNMLKGYQVRSVEEDNCYADELEEDIPVWNEKSEKRATFGEDLTSKQTKELQVLLNNFGSVFSDKPGRTDMAEHSIITEQTLPVRRPPYRLPHAYKELVKKELDEMLENGIIEATSSEWASPIVMVRKKDASLRMCVDYRRLNAVTHVDAYPMPRIDDLIDGLGNARFISTLDLTRGYWQMPVAKKDRHKTAFTTSYGQFQFRMLPFGLSGAPSSFQRLMDKLIKGCEGFASAYLDDLVVFSNSWEDHLSQLRMVLDRIKKAGLTVKAGKCQFGTSKCVYLGHMVGSGTVEPELGKLQAVKAFPLPETKRQVRGFLGLTGYYRRFIPDYSSQAAPLTDLTRKSATNTVKWTPQCNQAFEALKQCLCSKPVLRSPDFSKTFVLQTDASDRGVGAVLSQLSDDGEEHPVGYFSRKLLPREERYSTVEKECLAIRLAVEAFKVYLLGRKFVIQTDHRSLEWLERLKEGNPRLCRWSLALQPYEYTVEHRAGTANVNADALSRATNNFVAGEG